MTEQEINELNEVDKSVKSIISIRAKDKNENPELEIVYEFLDPDANSFERYEYTGEKKDKIPSIQVICKEFNYPNRMILNTYYGEKLIASKPLYDCRQKPQPQTPQPQPQNTIPSGQVLNGQDVINIIDRLLKDKDSKNESAELKDLIATIKNPTQSNSITNVLEENTKFMKSFLEQSEFFHKQRMETQSDYFKKLLEYKDVQSNSTISEMKNNFNVTLTETRNMLLDIIKEEKEKAREAIEAEKEKTREEKENFKNIKQKEFELEIEKIKVQSTQSASVGIVREVFEQLKEITPTALGVIGQIIQMKNGEIPMEDINIPAG